MNIPVCRFCGNRLSHTFVDLGMSPLSNAYVPADKASVMEPFYPLHVYVCERCFLVQLEEFETPERIFGDYAYFSSYSETWVEHVKRYTDVVVDRLSLDSSSMVVEIASNDGYLLQHFVAKSIPVLGIEPAANVAQAAVQKGIPTLVRFFGTKLAREIVSGNGRPADLIVANNVLAHVPDLNDFVEGLGILLKSGGIVTVEVPHLLRLIKENQFDTIYHEHFSYFSLMTLVNVFEAHGLSLFDVEELPTHGGSLRIYGRRKTEGGHVGPRVGEILAAERGEGMDRLETYLDFSDRVRKTKLKLLELFIDIKRSGKSIVGYGAPAKGNTLLNYCGIRTDFIDYTVDRSPHKQGLLLPGTHIPICHPDRIAETKPDYVVILPWNLTEEITAQMSHIAGWGGRFIVPIPEPMVIE